MRISSWNFVCMPKAMLINVISGIVYFRKIIFKSSWTNSLKLHEWAAGVLGVNIWDKNSHYISFKPLRPRQNGRHFPNDIFRCIFSNESVYISIKISLKFVPKGPINNIPALVQIMAWRRSGDKPLFEPMMVSLPTHICVTRPQWVKPVCVHWVDFRGRSQQPGHPAKVGGSPQGRPWPPQKLFQNNVWEPRVTRARYFPYSLSHASESLDLAQNTLCELVW